MDEDTRDSESDELVLDSAASQALASAAARVVIEKSAVADRMGFANLKFEEWFEPFANATDMPAPFLVGA